jgi:hypothetical protein
MWNSQTAHLSAVMTKRPFNGAFLCPVEHSIIQLVFHVEHLVVSPRFFLSGIGVPQVPKN